MFLNKLSNLYLNTIFRSKFHYLIYAEPSNCYDYLIDASQSSFIIFKGLEIKICRLTPKYEAI
jgi:hypothetical protein